MAWPRGSGEHVGSGYAPVTVVQALGEPFLGSGATAAQQGFVGGARTQAFAVASAG
jgi:hypothetical protein